MKLVEIFEQPVVIIFSWMILIIGILGAAKIVGSSLPKDGPMSGIGDQFRTV